MALSPGSYNSRGEGGEGVRVRTPGAPRDRSKMLLLEAVLVLTFVNCCLMWCYLYIPTNASSERGNTLWYTGTRRAPAFYKPGAHYFTSRNPESVNRCDVVCGFHETH